MLRSSKQRILCAYALLFTLAAGVIILDPVERQTEMLITDAAIPTPKVFKPSATPRSESNALQSERLAKR